MGFLDKAKGQAQVLAAKAQEGVKTGQEKLEQVQAARRADAMMRDLGVAVFLERTGRGSAQTTADAERLVAELSAHEAEHGIDASPKTQPAQAPAGEAQPGQAAPPPPAT